MNRLKRATLLGAYFLFGVIAVSWSAGCSSRSALEQVPRGAQGDVRLMELGRISLQDKKWEDARSYFRQLIDSYPRSELAGDARLGIADSYFSEGGSASLILAIAEYRDFLTFFPNHPRADYAQFQVANGYYRQIRSPDRDQEPTETAIEELEKLIELYRNSRYAEEGRGLLADCRQRLAESEVNAAEFYLEVRKFCPGAIPRLQGVISRFPEFEQMDRVHFLLAEALARCRRPNEAMPEYQKVIENYPQSALVTEAQVALEELKKAQAESQETAKNKPSPR